METERQDLYGKQLARMIGCETISVQGIHGGEEFDHFRHVLREEFPGVFSVMEESLFEGERLLLC